MLRAGVMKARTGMSKMFGQASSCQADRIGCWYSVDGSGEREREKESGRIIRETQDVEAQEVGLGTGELEWPTRKARVRGSDMRRHFQR